MPEGPVFDAENDGLLFYALSTRAMIFSDQMPSR